MHRSEHEGEAGAEPGDEASDEVDRFWAITEIVGAAADVQRGEKLTPWLVEMAGSTDGPQIPWRQGCSGVPQVGRYLPAAPQQAQARPDGGGAGAGVERSRELKLARAITHANRDRD